VGNQPHSEVAALALLLDKLQEGKSIDQDFSNPKLEIIPDLERKNVIEHKLKNTYQEEE